MPYPSPPPERTLQALAANKRKAAERADKRAARFREEAAELDRRVQQLSQRPVEPAEQAS
jgi:hypothetical protein